MVGNFREVFFFFFFFFFFFACFARKHKVTFQCGATSNCLNSPSCQTAPLTASANANRKSCCSKRRGITVIIRHGYMPQLLRNCILIPIPKSGKDPSQSDNYRPTALAPNPSKVLEWCILLQFGSYLSTSDLQFGFKSGTSTDSCTGLLKNTIALHIHRKTKVYGCFLDASKAFDRVSHNTLFNILERRDVPPILLRFLWSWYIQRPVLHC